MGVKRGDTTGTARRAKAEQLGQVLIAAAWRQFQAVGYAASTMGTVAEACGISVSVCLPPVSRKRKKGEKGRGEALRGEGPRPAEARSERAALG